MFKVLVIFTFISITLGLYDEDQGWVDWKDLYGKFHTFSNDKSELKAYLNFKTNEQKVSMHNANPKRSYDLGLNKYSIYDEATFGRKFCGLRKPKRLHLGKPMNDRSFAGPLGNFTVENVPKFVNYTKFYQPIQDQGSCGSCWAFATGSALEASLKSRDQNFKRVVSPSFFIDCDTANDGCSGGWPHDAVTFAKNFYNNQAPDKVSYPYKFPTNGTMRFSCQNVTKNLIKLGINSALFPGKLSIDDMKVLLANHGHIVVGLYSTGKFQNYKGGIFDESKGCFTGSGDANHAVVIVGYDSDKKFWIIRNSWGKSWGENGYMRMAFGESGLCNIERYPLVIT